ncbi:MAG: 50S ribosomal protein L25 [Dehalococcoidales bacterium]|nr:50S ribosomal protein L25 [Dehalococcoidales bacterium]
MESIELETTRREMLGKEVRFLRRQGIMPVHLFGHGIESLALQCDATSLQQTLSRAGQTRLINIKIHGENQPRPVVVRGVHREPVRGGLLHVDFFQVSMKELVKIDVPLILVGEAPILKSRDHMIVQELNTLAVECLPASMPGSLDLDVSSLSEPEQVLRVKDIKVDEDVAVQDDAELVVVRVILRQMAEIEEPVIAEEVVEPEEEPSPAEDE